jgi:hypothetical protein
VAFKPCSAESLSALFERRGGRVPRNLDRF